MIESVSIPGRVEIYDQEDTTPQAGQLSSHQKWVARIVWEPAGSLRLLLTSQLHLELYLEALGHTQDVCLYRDEARNSIVEETGPVIFGSENCLTTKELLIDAELVPPGTYRIWGIISPKDKVGRSLFLTGFIEGPVVQFYN
jgi:hypothetical protein